MKVAIAESLAAVHTHTHTHTIMSTKQDVNSTSLLNMFVKARTQYKLGCDPQLFWRTEA